MKEQTLWKKDFILVVIGQIISLFGNAILRFALPLYLFDKTQSPAILGIVSASSFLPMILLSPIGGIIADRVNKQRVMVILDFFTAIIVFIFSMVYGKVSLIPVFVIILMLLYGIQGAYQPTVQASIPLLASGEQLFPANAIINQISSMAGLLGPVLGGFLYNNFGLNSILTLSCICFVFSAVMELFIYIPFQKQPNNQSILNLVKSDMFQSIHFIFKEKPVLSKSIGIIFLFNLFMSSMLIIGLQVILRGILKINDNLYGISQGLLAAGGLAGGILAGVLGQKLSIKKSYLSLMLCALCCIPMGLALLVQAPKMIIYIIITTMSFILMMFSNIFTIQMFSFIQIETPPNLLGKVISCLLAFSICAQPIGQAIYGLLFEVFAAKSWMIILGTSIVSLGIGYFSKKIFKTLTLEEKKIL